MRTAAPATALAALLLAAGPARAELKIGYVNFQRALNEVEEGKIAKASLKKDFDEKQKQLDRDRVELERMEAELRKQEAVLSEEAKRDKLMELQRKAGEATQRMQAFQKELSDREREVTRGIFDKMVAITREIADHEGFTMVFEKNDAGLVVAPDSLDVTNELIRKYNARHKPGPAAEAKKAPEVKGGDKKKDGEKKKAEEKAKTEGGK